MSDATRTANVEIRIGTTDDASRLADILRSVEAEVHPWFSAERREEQAELLVHAMQYRPYQASILLVSGDVHGCSFAGAEDHHIYWFYVDAPYRSQGCGKRILDELKSQHEFLTLDVWTANARAVAFYKREGFVEVPAGQQTGVGQVRMRWDRPTRAIDATPSASLV